MIVTRIVNRKTNDMTPTEKATELINKFFAPLEESVTNHLVGQRKRFAKNHALICVEEILDVLGGEGVYNFADPKIEEFWESVKSEIKNA